MVTVGGELVKIWIDRKGPGSPTGTVLVECVEFL